MRSGLFDPAHAASPDGGRWVLQSRRMLQVGLGPDVLAGKGLMVAYRGQVRFTHEGAGSLGRLVKKVITTSDAPLMRVSGQGHVYLARLAEHVFTVDLEGDGISVDGSHLMAFDDTVAWDIRRVGGAGVLGAGLFTLELTGHGTVALTCDGPPMLLDCSVPTFVDPHAAVAWSSSLVPRAVSSMNVRSMLRGGTGEAVQLAFHGRGFVVVQPSEGRPGSGGGGGGGSGFLGDVFS